MENKLRIIPAKPENAGELLEIYRPYVENTAVSFEYTVPTVEEFRERIISTLQRFPYLIAVQEGEILGYAYCSPFKTREAYNWCVETSIYVKTDKRQSGVGRKLYEKLEEILQKQGILNVNACIAKPVGEDPYLTADSINFHEKMGYKTVAEFHSCGYKFNRWYDMIWMEKMIGEHLQKQPKVQAFREDML